MGGMMGGKSPDMSAAIKAQEEQLALAEAERVKAQQKESDAKRKLLQQQMAGRRSLVSGSETGTGRSTLG